MNANDGFSAQRDFFSISVVIAVRNSSVEFINLLEHIDEWLSCLNLPYEIILVDDASLVPVSSSSLPQTVVVYRLAEPVGQQMALLYGFRKSSNEWIYTQDDDILPSIEELKKLLFSSFQCDSSLNYGTYESRSRLHWRHWFGLIVRGAYALFANQWKQPTSLRFFKRELINAIPTSRFPLFLESWLLAVAPSVSFTPITVHRFSNQPSRYNIRSLIVLATKVLLLYTSMPFWIIAMCIWGVVYSTHSAVAGYLAPLLVAGNWVLIRVWGCPMGIWAGRRIWGKSH